MDTVKVYYNSACPVCKAGVASQQCRMDGADGAEGAQVEWIDVHADPAAAHEAGADVETIRERLHVRDADGAILVGTDAFAALFRRTAGQRWLGRLLVAPGIRWASQRMYNGFARLLYWWNRAHGRW